MYYDEHNPPHFHAIYNEYEAVISVKDFGVLYGDLPPKALGMVSEWTRIHREELLVEWELARGEKKLFEIEPLK